MAIFLKGPSAELYDLIVIGAGPAGATATLYGARAGLKVLALDKGIYDGAAGRAQRIENYPGIPGPISGAELVRIIREQAEGFGAEIREEKVLSAEVTKDPKEVRTTSGIYRARAVIVATGAMGRDKYHAPIGGSEGGQRWPNSSSWYRRRSARPYGRITSTTS